MQRLRVLAAKLNDRGLHTEFGTCATGTPAGHFDSVYVSNPAAAGRGLFHVDGDGSVEWTFPGSALDDDDAIGRLVDEAISALRASGVRLPRRQPKQP